MRPAQGSAHPLHNGRSAVTLAADRSPFDLTGRVAVVTGGGRGIGLAIARGLGAAGAQILIADRDEPRGAAAVAALQDAGVRAVCLRTDVTDPSSIGAALDAAESGLGGFDILVNNAGMSQRTPAEEYSPEDLRRMTALNLDGVFFGMQAAARRWIAARRPGSIVNLASFAGVVADPLSAPYAATKGAVVQLTRTCAVEWAPHGIRVNAIGPGYVRTEMTAPALAEPETRRRILERTPLGRVAEPEDLAGAAVFLASDASRYVTGHVLMVDGGWTAL
jgi:NAD(P)-dependent dehydrogenase (short-subunit alcohol dehydrogenase family)